MTEVEEARRRGMREAANLICDWCRQNRPFRHDEDGYYHGWRVKGGERQENCKAEAVRITLLEEA